MDRDYTNGELGIMLLDIKEQTTKINDKVANIVAWKERVHGIWIATCIFAGVVSVVLPIIIDVYFK